MPDPEVACRQLAYQYDVAIASAMACDVGGTGQCQTHVVLSLSCGCQTFVNDSTEVDVLHGRWQAMGCVANQMDCPTGCPPTSGAICTANDAGAGKCRSF